MATTILLALVTVGPDEWLATVKRHLLAKERSLPRVAIDFRLIRGTSVSAGTIRSAPGITRLSAAPLDAAMGKPTLFVFEFPAEARSYYFDGKEVTNPAILPFKDYNPLDGQDPREFLGTRAVGEYMTLVEQMTAHPPSAVAMDADGKQVTVEIQRPGRPTTRYTIDYGPDPLVRNITISDGRATGWKTLVEAGVADGIRYPAKIRIGSERVGVVRPPFVMEVVIDKFSAEGQDPSPEWTKTKADAGIAWVDRRQAGTKAKRAKLAVADSPATKDPSGPTALPGAIPMTVAAPAWSWLSIGGFVLGGVCLLSALAGLLRRRPAGALLLAALAAGASGCGGPSAPGSQAGPAFRLERPDGPPPRFKVADGPHRTVAAQAAFRIHNDTASAATIADVETGCGCAGASLSSRTVPPGGGVDLTITVNGDPFRAKHVAFAALFADPALPRLEGFADVEPTADVPLLFTDPEVRLGSLAPAESLTLELVAWEAAKGAPWLVEVRAAGRSFAAKPLGAQVKEGVAIRRYRVTLDGPGLASPLAAAAHAADGREVGRLHLHFERRQPWAAVPAELVMAVDRVPIERMVTLRTDTGADLKAVAASVDVPWATLVRPGAAALWRLSVDPRLLADRSANARISFRDGGGVLVAEVPIHAFRP